MPDSVLGRVRAAFLDADYTVAGVRALLGPVAGGALARDVIVPALRGTSGGTDLERFVRLFWLQVPVPSGHARDADLVAAGLAEDDGGELRPLLHVEPLESVTGAGHVGWTVSDLKVRPGSGRPVGPDHVVGAGGASASLARLVVHSPVENVLDLGTGCGVQALHLADPAIGRRPARITATDVHPRALRLAALSFELSGLDGVELLQGSLFEPVADRRFDLVVSNPPFVVAPPGGTRRTYRESGLPGDDFCRLLVASARDRLTDGGRCHLLANWLDVEGEGWAERVGGWAEASGCDAWIVQRDVQDPAEYAELWLRDAAETDAYAERYEAWLDDFERQKVNGVGFGWITLRRRDEGRPVVRVEDLRHAVQEPVGAYVDDVLNALAEAPEFSTAWGKLRLADGVIQEQVGPPGAPDPERILLRQTSGLRRAAGVGTVEAALAGVCDGTLPLEPLLDAIAQLLAHDPAEVRAHAAAVLPELIADGFLIPA
ncbi:Release factor glutamine methyltransferase [Actinomadura rubteroloni]|uniref:Release factor glutamine methyltransferase n=1 Tax=Actinomadura rubteroloni TaxID=1926885 RepID=A0A2P4ULC2_9ACTN|nr:methyltransferase [Actinomadura rubteroloni]POM25854.1 Release factor glutamine methyltransferase [Actinomadura rubteroloni]